MKTEFYDPNGNVFEYDSETGLISRNNVIVSGEEFEPVFARFLENEAPPIVVGIYFKYLNKVLGKSGRLNDLTNSEKL